MARRRAIGLRAGEATNLPRRSGSTKASRTRRLNLIEQFRREMETYFQEHPEEIGRTWLPRKFGTVRDCTRYYGWLRTNNLLPPPRYRVITRGAYAFHTITDDGECWDEHGDLVPLPLWWRKEQALEAHWLQSSQHSSTLPE